MSFSDKHFIDPWDMTNKSGEASLLCRLITTVDKGLAVRERLLRNFRERYTNALGDVGSRNHLEIEMFLNHLEKLVAHLLPESGDGKLLKGAATIA